MPASLAAALMPFQSKGVRYAIERQGRCLIADEMGVGKTLQAIALASCYQVMTSVIASALPSNSMRVRCHHK